MATPPKIYDPYIARPDDMAPIEAGIPPIEAVQQLPVADRLKVAQRFGWYPPPREYQEAVQKYVADFSKMPPGSADFKTEVQRLTADFGSKRTALGIARGGMRNYQQTAAMNGDPETNLSRICEDDTASCNGCIEKQGEEGTIAYHRAIGAPGNQECGSNCRCELHAVDKKPGSNWLLSAAVAAGVIAAVLGD